MRASARVTIVCPVSTWSGSRTSVCRSRWPTGAYARLTAPVRETAAETGFFTAVNTEGAKDGKSGHLLSQGQDVVWPGGGGHHGAREKCSAHRCGRDERSGRGAKGWAPVVVPLYR